jgi:hypothetical protein
MASSIQTPIALPNEVNFSLPSSLPSATNREVRIQPVNGGSFDTAGQVIQFDIPCGQSGDYLDPTTTYVRFRSTFAYSGGTAGTDYSYLLGSGYSFFNKQDVYGNNNQVLESINEVGVLTNMLFNCQLSDSDKRGLSGMLGFNYTQGTNYASSSSAGHLINNNSAANSDILQGLSFEYCIPLIGILGSGTSKLIPVGKLLGLRLELTLDLYSNITKAATAAAAVSKFTLSNIEFVANYIRLSPEAEQMINQQNPEKIHIRTQTWKQTSNSIPASTGIGTVDVLCPIRVNSLKSVYACIYPADAMEGKFAGVNPNLAQGTCFQIGGSNFPQRTLDPSGKPADAFAELQKSFGALSYNAYNSCISKNAYYSGTYGTDTYTTSLCSAYNSYSVANIAKIVTDPNQFYLGIDTEVLARKDSLLSGVNTTSTPMMFRAQTGWALNAQIHYINFFGFYDVILEIDVQSKSVVALN